MSEQSMVQRSPEEWRAAIGRFELSLEDSLRRSYELDPPAALTSESSGLADILHRLEERLNRLEAHLQGADREMAHADSLLAAEIQALEQWLSGWTQSRQALSQLLNPRM